MKQMNDNLSDEQKAVLFDKSTEAAFTGALLDNKGAGSYRCANCAATLFDSKTKFDSGSGWPSFYDVANEDSVTLIDDDSHGMSRVEATCSKCGGHLGHVFNDGHDQPTGKRYCINSLSLEFEKDK